MPTGSYLARRAMYQLSHLDGKTDNASESEQLPSELAVEIGSAKFGRRMADVKRTIPAGSDRDQKNGLK
jgi:hypothetical protein